MEVRVGNDKSAKESSGILTSNSWCDKYDGPGKDGEVVLVQCKNFATKKVQPINGKYITIQKKQNGKTKAINMAEVEVFGNYIGKL